MKRTRSKSSTPGSRFRAALKKDRPLQVVGTINAYSALLAEKAGHRAIYLSGAGVANASYGFPDLGVTTLDNVLEDVRRITAVTELPLLVDADTGWGNPRKTVREMIKAGAAGIHLEDQVEAKRCGHRPNKQLVSTAQMIARLRAAVAGKTNRDFVVMARTDAVAGEGLEKGIQRACAYRDAGADMIFAEALSDLSQYQQFAERVKIPVLANITEFGKTPLYTVKQLASAKIALALYPLSAFRAMSLAALEVYVTLRRSGTQKKLLSKMQTRAELYEILNYEACEKKIDAQQKPAKRRK